MTPDLLPGRRVLARRASALLGAVALAGCASLSVHDDTIPTDRLVAQAEEAVHGDPEEQRDGHAQWAWLCLLRGVACTQLPEHARSLVPDRPMQVQPAPLLAALALRALALDGGRDLAERTNAWLDVAVAASTPRALDSAFREQALLAAARAIAGVHRRDPDVVAAALRHRPDDAGRLLDAGGAAGRWLRTRALSPLIAAGDWSGGEASPLRWQQPTLRVSGAPLSARAHLAIARATAAEASSGVESAHEARPEFAGSAPLGARQRGAWTLAVRKGGAWRLALAFPSLASPSVLLLRMPKAFRAFAAPGGSWTELSQQRLTDDGVTALSLPADVTEVRLLAVLAAGPQSIEATLLQDPELQPLLQTPPVQVVELALSRALAGLGGLRAVPAERMRPLEAVVALQHALVEAEQPGEQPEQRVIDAVLSALPGHLEARLATVHRLLDDGNVAQAARWLGALSDTAVDSARPDPARSGERLDVLLTESAVRHAEGLTDLAIQAVDLALGRGTTRCSVRAIALQLGLDTLQREPLRRWQASPNRADGCVEIALLQANVWRSLGENARAAAWVAKALLEPKQQAGAAQVAAELGLPVDPELLPDAARWQAIESAWDGQTQQQRESALLALLLDPNASLPLKERALQAGARAPWLPLLRDGLQLAAQPDDSKLVEGASTAWLLDQELVLLLPGGGAVRRVHQVLRVLQDSAAEAVGEVQVPDGAELELARTILADGTVIQPAETADKSSVSLRMVEAGAAVEYAQTIFVPADDAVSAATRLPNFLFQATDAPVRLSEYAVVVPVGMKLEAEPTRWLPPAEIRTLEGGMTAWIWRTGNLPALPDEPRAVRPELARPAVRVTAATSTATFLDRFDDLLLGWLELRSTALSSWEAAFQTFPKNTKGLQLLAARLSRLTEYQHDGGEPASPAQIAQDGKGDRATLFWWLARRRGLDACLVRVAPLARLPLRTPTDPGDFAMELVRVRVDGREVWYDPGLEGGLLDHVRSGLRGREGWTVGCGQAESEPQRKLVVPPLGEGRDGRVVRAEVLWNLDGSIRVDVDEELQGALAGAVRQFFWQADRSRYSSLIRDLAGESWPGLEGELIDLEGVADLGGPMRLRYRLTGAAQAARTAQLEVGLVPSGLGQTYAGLPRRVSQLLFGWGAEETVEVRISSPTAVRFAPVELRADAGPVRWSLRTYADGATAVLHKTVVSRPAVVGPDEYPGFATTLRQLDAAERVRLTR